MPLSRIRFVTACQQLLALGLVLAVLTPAASIISLDVVHDSPASAGPTGLAADLSAYVKESARASTVPDEVVDPTVTEVDLTPATGAGAAARAEARENVVAPPASARGRSAVGGSADSTLTSRPEPVVGYGAVGVTWEHGVKVPESGIALQVRTRTGDDWSGWMDLEYHDDHGPDPGSAEARHARPGTDALLVGDVDDVQVKVDTTTGDLPAGLQMAVIDPGTADRSAVEHPALDTDGAEAEAPATPPASTDGAAPDTVATDPGQGDDGTDAISLQAARYTPKPQIYSRAQWGADEKMRDKSSLHYFEVHAGFVHHTVNANDYTRAQVPGIIRSIYAYHTKSRGWSDIGYNFLVDRFGRIWEGRYGGIDRPVVGAHTLNYNDYAFAMSAIGNYDIKQPSSAMVQAYGALFAWKLSLHGIDASSTKQQVGPKSFQAINGHRDAASTACPGKYLYAQIPTIRRLAAAAQRGWSGRELESNLASTTHPDLVVRRASDKQVFVVATGGLTAVSGPVAAATVLAGSGRTVVTPDVTGDGVTDLVVQATDGNARVRAGTGKGTFASPRAKFGQLRGHDLFAAAGDLNGDGRNDLVARVTATGRLDALIGRGNGTFATHHLTTGWAGYNLLSGAGDVTGDKRPDVLARDTAGKLWLYPGTGKGNLGARVALAGSWSSFSSIEALGDFTGDGRPDLFVRSGSTGYGYVKPGLGQGTYGSALGPLSGLAKVDRVLGVGQVVRDGKPDIVTRTGTKVSVYGNLGGTEIRRQIATGTKLPTANALFNAGDWDRDGHGDIISRTTKGVLELRRGNGLGRFGPPIVIGTGFGAVRLLAAVGDATGDGFPDLMGQPSRGAVRIYPGRGTAGLRTSYVAHGAITASEQIPVGRWNADGAPDSLFRSGAKTTLYPGNGPGGLTGGRALKLDLRAYDWVIGISDISVTGHSDLVVRTRTSGLLYLIPGTATGFGKPRLLTQGMGKYDLGG
ncbi:FG-GAP-like repeat-containing protein [Nocardioides sp. URHA0020]|uniref:FG-GAP-like repeat-containing protein n=1 Tax=Nocardioides sp. URHA0020 TaxID=1380392 RepID=UPI000684EFD3|nr:FG-GAP-like repeat-containing protein [Nocardioides sp. URHA0020]